jgi:hypothetical protein
MLPLALAAAGCRNNMHTQNKVRPLRESTFFDDGATARPLPADTVAHDENFGTDERGGGGLRADDAFTTGLGADGKPVSELPLPLSRELLLRGRQRFDIFCSPCHGRLGDGRGMIVQRGYKQPHSFHEERLRASNVGYFFNVASVGFGVMPSYAAQIPVADRWAIAAYIRVLQYSQGAPLSDLPAETRRSLASDLAAPPPSPGAPAAPAAGNGAAAQPRRAHPNEVP